VQDVWFVPEIQESMEIQETVDIVDGMDATTISCVSLENGGKNMPEIRASVTVEVHRKLKEEAARNGKHLKELINEILIWHVKNGEGGGKGRAAKKA